MMTSRKRGAHGGDGVEKRVPTPGTNAPVALGGEVAYEPGLPLPWVLYPRHYGVFHAFAATQEGPYRLCSCTGTGLPTAVADVRASQPSYGSGPGARDLARDYVWLPGTAASHLDDFVEGDRNPALFADAVCHRCVLRTPSLRWAHEMYETQFNQFHGWYTKQCAVRAGFFARGPDCAAGPFADPELAALRSRVKEWANLPDPALVRGAPDPRQTLWDKAAEREWRVVFQNEARAEFGYRKVGEAWIAETQMAALVAELVVPAALERHYRPAWLDGLELDVWVADLRVGFEYQGQQHFHPIKAWGGPAALKQVQARDARKVELCRAEKVRLVVVDYTEPLTRTHLENRLRAALAAPA